MFFKESENDLHCLFKRFGHFVHVITDQFPNNMSPSSCTHHTSFCNHVDSLTTSSGHWWNPPLQDHWSAAACRTAAEPTFTSKVMIDLDVVYGRQYQNYLHLSLTMAILIHYKLLSSSLTFFLTNSFILLRVVEETNKQKQKVLYFPKYK